VIYKHSEEYIQQKMQLAENGNTEEYNQKNKALHRFQIDFAAILTGWRDAEYALDLAKDLINLKSNATPMEIANTMIEIAERYRTSVNFK